MSIGVGLLGCGTVGTGVVRLLRNNAAKLQAVLDTPMQIRRIAVRDTSKKRGVDLGDVLTDDPAAVIADEQVDIVVELMGGVDTALGYVKAALDAKKPVVTANKALLATHAGEILEAARTAGVGVYFEAAVAGGIPILRSLRQGLAANRVEGIWGIVNGTSNYILSEMARDGVPFSEALSLAQELGYAEADPTLDVDGFDAAQKLVVLAACAYGLGAAESEVFVQGLRSVTPLDIQYAHELGYTIRPLAIASRAGDAVTLRVHPSMVPSDHLLATVDGAFNAVYVVGDPVGPTLHTGQGAGAGPTASAVVSDLIDAVRHLGHAHPCMGFPRKPEGLHLGDVGDVRSEYYLRFSAWDRPGVLSRIAGALGEQGISIAQVLQREHAPDESVPVIVLTHTCTERNLQAAIREIDAQPVVSAPTMVLRVEAFGNESTGES